MNKTDYAVLAILVSCLAIISVTAPALYVILWIVAGFIGIATLAFVVTKDLLGSDCPLDNLIGINAIMSLASLLLSMSNE